MMDQLLNHWNGVIGIADAVVIYDKDDVEHDRCLHLVMEVAHKHGLMFTDRKCAVKQPSVM